MDNSNYHKLYDNNAYRKVSTAVSKQFERGVFDDKCIAFMNAVQDHAIEASNGRELAFCIYKVARDAASLGIGLDAMIEAVRFVSRFKVQS